ncbi:MAG TPA: hypothetical protein VKQ32_25420 [Polyangia bacterium]|nr:hypothetical protein [Polyangia bacterium]
MRHIAGIGGVAWSFGGIASISGGRRVVARVARAVPGPLSAAQDHDRHDGPAHPQYLIFSHRAWHRQTSRVSFPRVSTGAIVVISIVGLLVAVFVPLRIDVAKQRRAVETVRARLAAARVRRRADGIPVLAIQQLGRHVTHVSRPSTVAFAEDGLYCLSEDGRWGGRIPLAPGPSGPGDFTLAASPTLVKDGRIVDDVVPESSATGLAALPAEGLLLQFPGGLAWFLAVPDAAAWHAALMPAFRAPP